MSSSENRHRRASNLTSSVSAIAIITYLGTVGNVAAQTVINDGDNVTVTSAANGETIEVAAGVSSTVSNAPVVVFNNDDVTLENAGRLSTTGVTQTVQVGPSVERGTINNAATGSIEAESRVINIQNTDLTVNNTGQIIGSGDQRNGTVYADSTAQDFTLNNQAGGVIDAGAGNLGAGFSVELSEAGNNFDINNEGIIQGRGDAGAGLATAGDGIRLERARVDGALDGTTTGLFTGTITNSGTIASEGANGTVGGFRAVNGVSFQGTLNNEAGGTISGTQNGVYFGNATPAGGGENTGTVNNAGVFSSDSRALNIDGGGLTVNNTGQIIGTGDQRNGTVYADSTAQDFTLNNQAGGVIDAGSGNLGAGFSVELSEAGNNFDINNEGIIQGRGDAGAGVATAGDGIRLERERVAGALDGTTTGLFTGTITNSGTIASEGANGTVGGFRAVNGVSFQGTLNNEAGGTISGTQNGVYFGNATPAGGGENTGTVNNAGVISSDSRALNIDGTGLTVNNTGQIIGTGDQRNGTVYADSTAQDFTLNNQAGGLIDAGAGNEGSGISLQLGTADGDTRNLTIVNAGTVTGRGEALASGETAGLRFFSGAGAGSTVTVDGIVENSGIISSETSAAILVEDVTLTPTILNTGTLSGTRSVDASSATGGINVENRAGTLSGDFVGSDFDDTLAFTGGTSALTDDVLNGVAVTVAGDSTLDVNGARSIDGTFAQTGNSVFELGQDTLTVSGDANLLAGSTVTVNVPADISALAIGEAIPVITETGDLSNNNATVVLSENSFLVDFDVETNAVVVTASAANLADVSDDTNVSALNDGITQAVTAGALPAAVFTALDGLENNAEFESAAVTLLPTIHNGVTREIFETGKLASRRLETLRGKQQRGVWGEVFGRTAEQDQRSVSDTGYDANAFGITIGGALPVTETLSAGASFTYSDIDIDDNGGGNSEVDSFRVAGNLAYRSGAAFANAEVGYSVSDVETSRVAVGESVTGSYDVDGFDAKIAAGYDFAVNGATITPTAGLRYGRFSADDFSENGGLNLQIDQDDVEFLEASIGLSAQTTVQVGTVAVTSKVRAAYVYDVVGDERTLTASFAGASPIELRSEDPSQSRFELGLGLDAKISDSVSLGLGYEGGFSSDNESHAGVLRLSVKF